MIMIIASSSHMTSGPPTGHVGAPHSTSAGGDEALDAGDGSEVVGGDLGVRDGDAEPLLQERDELEDAERVDDPAVDEVLVVVQVRAAGGGRQPLDDEGADRTGVAVDVEHSGL